MHNSELYAEWGNKNIQMAMQSFASVTQEQRAQSYKN